jgi:hypothetical protein
MSLYIDVRTYSAVAHVHLPSDVVAHDPWPLHDASSQHLPSVQRPDEQPELSLQVVPSAAELESTQASVRVGDVPTCPPGQLSQDEPEDDL